MSEFDVTLCKFYNNEICYNEECPVKYCDGYQCIYKERYLLREHCKFIDETNKILNEQKESLLKENEKLKQDLQKESELVHRAICEEADNFFQVMKLQKALDEIEEICKECKKHDYDRCVRCKYEEKCRGEEFEPYDITNFILEILQKIKEVKCDE